LIPLAYKTASGLKIGVWVERLIKTKKAHSQIRGPAFSNHSGRRLSQQWVEMEVLNGLHWIQSKYLELIHKDLNVYEEYGISRSFHRVATTHARNQKVTESDIDIINRWRKVEGGQGRRPKLRMQDHYSKICQLAPSLFRFSAAL
jgi:hypothetical protein